jgi:hypothetical protein
MVACRFAICADPTLFYQGCDTATPYVLRAFHSFAARLLTVVLESTETPLPDCSKGKF